MNRKVYNKLVRDKIPEIIKQNKGIPKTSKLTAKQFRIALKEKLLEEAKELQEADGKESILNELSDVLQLVESIARNNNLSLADIKKQQVRKKKERGAFEKRIFLKYVDEPK